MRLIIEQSIFNRRPLGDVLSSPRVRGVFRRLGLKDDGDVAGLPALPAGVTSLIAPMVMQAAAPARPPQGGSCACGPSTPGVLVQAGCTVPQPPGEGDIPRRNPMVQVPTHFIECGSILSKTFPDAYQMRTSTLVSRLAMLRSMAVCSPTLANGAVALGAALTVALATADSSTRTALGFYVSITLAEENQRTPFLLTLSAPFPAGLGFYSASTWTTGAMMCEPGPDGKFAAVFYPWARFNDLDLSAMGMIVGQTGTQLTTATMTGAPNGSSLVAKSIQTDDPKAQWLLGQFAEGG